MKNQNTYIHGSHNELCDVCGFKFKTEDMHTRWDGLRVCHDDYEERHPMDFFRGVPDDQNVNDPDADDTDNSGVNTTLPSVTGTIADQTSIINEVISLDASTAFAEGDGDVVEYTATGLPASLTIDSQTGIISGTINGQADDNSPYSCTVSLRTTASFVYTVSTTFSWGVSGIIVDPTLLIWMRGENLTDTGGNYDNLWPNDPTAIGGPDYDMTRQGSAMSVRTVNGNRVIHSPDLTSRYFENVGSPLITSGFTLFFVGAFEDPADHNTRLFTRNGSAGVDFVELFISGLTIDLFSDAAGFIGVGTATNVSSTKVVAARMDSGNYRGRINPEAWITDVQITDQDYQFGKFLQARNSDQAVGWVGEFIVYNIPLTDAEMDTIYSDLITKWGA